MTNSPTIRTILRPTLAYVDGRFEAHRDIHLAPDGTIASVTAAGESSEQVIHLPGRALMPGFVNAHSHAFQRAIRGQTHTRTGRANDDFWSWRNAMYQVLGQVDADTLEDISRFAFMEMLLAGYTSVGEFHYVHHGRDGVPYSDPNLLAKSVIRAARDVGIRITLLRVVYLRTGFDDTAPNDGQKRFIDHSLTEALDRTETLSEWIHEQEDPCVRLGIAPHSVRAVSREDLREVAKWARQAGLPLHIHASEQPAEVEACRQKWGISPIGLLAAEDALGEQTTVIHGTHIDNDDIQALSSSKTTVCVCPTTEADLGDGLLPASALLEAGVPLALGSDSQAVVDPFQEMRCLEMHERLRTGKRVCLIGSNDGTADTVFETATSGGAHSIGCPSSTICAGAPADVITVDLNHPVLAGWKPDTLMDMLAHHGSLSLVKEVWVHGEEKVTNGQHPRFIQIKDRFEAAMEIVSSG